MRNLLITLCLFPAVFCSAYAEVFTGITVVKDGKTYDRATQLPITGTIEKTFNESSFVNEITDNFHRN